MKKKSIALLVSVLMLTMFFTGCGGNTNTADGTPGTESPDNTPSRSADSTPTGTPNPTPDSSEPADGSTPVVYMTTDISPESLIAVYEALGREATGNVAFKIHFGEPGGNYYLSPDLIKDLVQSVDGTIVESNTAGGIGSRGVTAMHLQVAEDHGYTAIAPVEILDADGEISLPVQNGKHLEEDIVGAAFADYDFHIVLYS